MKRMKGSVFSISLGQLRTIVFRIWEPIAENTKQRTLIKLDMPHGSMLRMWPDCNHYLSHQVVLSVGLYSHNNQNIHLMYVFRCRKPPRFKSQQQKIQDTRTESTSLFAM